MKQNTLARQADLEKFGRKSRRDLFLDAMNEIVPWGQLESLVEPHYAWSGRMRRPMSVSILLKIFFLQHWFNLSDAGVEEALYDSAALRRFAGVNLDRAPAPDEITVGQFRQLLETNNLRREILDIVNFHLNEKGVRISAGKIIDATILHAPS